jgi:hypothetical protein
MMIHIGFGFHRDLKMESDQNLSHASGGEKEEKHAVLGGGGQRLEARAANDGVDGGTNLVGGGAGVLGVAAGWPRACHPHLHRPRGRRRSGSSMEA